MNKYFYALFTLLLVASSSLIQAKVGCMDNSWHLQKKYDAKEYHYVECNCPCTNTIANRNQCPCCGHYHDAETWEMIRYDSKNPPTTSKKLVRMPENALRALKKRIVAYNKQKNNLKN